MVQRTSQSNTMHVSLNKIENETMRRKILITPCAFWPLRRTQACAFRSVGKMKLKIEIFSRCGFSNSHSFFSRRHDDDLKHDETICVHRYTLGPTTTVMSERLTLNGVLIDKASAILYRYYYDGFICRSCILSKNNNNLHNDVVLAFADSLSLSLSLSPSLSLCLSLPVVCKPPQVVVVVDCRTRSEKVELVVAPFSLRFGLCFSNFDSYN
jgi:hypothetical protein